MTVVWVFGGAAVLLLGLAIWAGHRMLTAPGAGSGGASDADDHPRWTVDLHRSQVRIPRPR